MKEYAQKKLLLTLLFLVLTLEFACPPIVAKADSCQLITAIKTGNPGQVKNLLDQGYDPNITDSFGEAALLLVTQSPAIKFTKRQKAGKADVEIKKYLHHDEIVRLLVKHGAIVNVHNAEGWTPLLQAQASDEWQLADFLIKSGAIQFRKVIQHVSPKSKNLNLITAIKAGDADRVKDLLDRGCDPNIADKNGEAAILLLKNAPAIKVESKQNDGKNDGTNKRYLNHEKIVRLLVEHGAKVNVRNEEGWTPLLQAHASHVLELANFLIKSGAVKSNISPQLVKKRPVNAEMIAAIKAGDARRVKDLLDQGCDPNITDSDGQAAILLIYHAPKSVAIFGSRLDGGASVVYSYLNQDIIVRLLVEHGALVNVHDRYGWTPLLQAQAAANSRLPAFLIGNMAYVFAVKLPSR